VAEILPGGELMQAHPLDEIGFGVDDGDLEVVGMELAGQVSGGEGSGVSGPEDDDAVLHGWLLSRSCAP
jgi:hypothetical protein